jgi:hypothetical protein
LVRVAGVCACRLTLVGRIRLTRFVERFMRLRSDIV